LLNVLTVASEAASPQPPDKVQATLDLIKKCQTASNIARNQGEGSHTSQDEQEDGAMEFAQFEDDAPPDEQDINMYDEDEPQKDIVDLFQLEVVDLVDREAEQDGVEQEAGGGRGDEEEGSQFHWDQAEPEGESDNDELRAGEAARWEDIQRLLLEERKPLIYGTLLWLTSLQKMKGSLIRILQISEGLHTTSSIPTHVKL
jgi:hypothetical protein